MAGSSLIRRIARGILTGLALVVIGFTGFFVWSSWVLREAEEGFAAVAVSAPDSPATVSSDQLIAAAAPAADLQWNAEERKRIGTLATMPLDRWTEDDDALVAEIVERNRAHLETVQRVLENSAPDAAGNAENRSSLSVHLDLIRIARLLAADARRTARHESWDETFRRLTPLKAMADGMESRGPFFDLTMGTAFEAILDQSLSDIAAGRPTLDDASLPWNDLVPQTDIPAMLRNGLTIETERWAGAWDEGKEELGLPGLALSPLTEPIFRRFFRAAFLDVGIRLLTLVDTPYGADPEAFENPAAASDWQVIRGVAGMMLPSMVNAVARCQAAAAQRQLLDAVLAVQTVARNAGAFPTERPDVSALTQPDPFSGKPLKYEILEDGGVRIAVTDGPALLERLRIPGGSRALDPVILRPFDPVDE